MYPWLPTLLIIHSVGIDAYVRRKGFNDPVILELGTGLIANWEFRLEISIGPSYVTSHFVIGMHRCLQGLEPDEVNRLSEDDSQLSVWAEVFIVRR